MNLVEPVDAATDAPRGLASRVTGADWLVLRATRRMPDRSAGEAAYPRAATIDNACVNIALRYRSG
jgi:hypothetical protein